jgi:hypothetical protein
MKEISVNMTTVEVKAQTRALRANWTREVIHDINSMGGISLALEREIMISIRKDKRMNSIKNIFPN